MTGQHFIRFSLLHQCPFVLSLLTKKAGPLRASLGQRDNSVITIPAIKKQEERKYGRVRRWLRTKMLVAVMATFYVSSFFHASFSFQRRKTTYICFVVRRNHRPAMKSLIRWMAVCTVNFSRSLDVLMEK